MSAWVGRQIRVDNRQRYGRTSTNGVLKEVVKNGKSAIVKVGNHPEPVIIPITEIKPWWSKNPDLQEKAEKAKEMNT